MPTDFPRYHWMHNWTLLLNTEEFQSTWMMDLKKQKKGNAFAWIPWTNIFMIFFIIVANIKFISDLIFCYGMVHFRPRMIEMNAAKPRRLRSEACVSVFQAFVSPWTPHFQGDSLLILLSQGNAKQ